MYILAMTLIQDTNFVSNVKIYLLFGGQKASERAQIEFTDSLNVIVLQIILHVGQKQADCPVFTRT